MSSRVPRLVLVAWGLAAVIVAGLVVAVVRHLRSGGAHVHGMHGMHAATALTRGSAQPPTDDLTVAGLFTAWHLDAVAVAVVVLLGAAYLTGVALVGARSPGERWPRWRTAAFFAGLAVIAYATNGAIAVYDQVLFTAHMAGHLALVMVAPSLLIAGYPLTLALLAAPPRRRERLARAARGRVVAVLTAPPVALAAYTVVIVGSHLTGIMDVIMRNTWAGQVEHLVYLLVGCQFFVLVVGAEPIRWRPGAPARFLLLGIAMAVDTVTGIVLIQGTKAVALLPSALDVDALANTRTGGAIMWVGGDAIMMLLMVGLAVRWIRTVETAPVDHGWLEQARGAAFTAHTGGAAGDGSGAVDDDSEAAREAYNRWLARLDSR